MPRMHIFLKNTVNTNPKLFRAQFSGTGCRLWITACDRSLQNVVNVTQKTLFLIDCLQMSRIRYVLKCIHRRGWSHSTETHFTPMKSTGSCLLTWETSHLKFAHERCVKSSRSPDHEGTPAWTMTNFHQPGEPTEKYTDLFGHGHTIDLYNSPVSLGRAVCNRNEAF